MVKKLLSLILAGLLMQLSFVWPVAASAKAEDEARLAEKVKAGVMKLGTGTEALVEVKLRDERKLKGYVREAGAEQFTVVDAKTGVATPVAYPQVKTVKGNNLSEGVKIALAVGAVIGAIILVVALSVPKS